MATDSVIEHGQVWIYDYNGHEEVVRFVTKNQVGFEITTGSLAPGWRQWPRRQFLKKHSWSGKWAS